MKITKKTHPKEWAMIKKAFPSYRKTSARLCFVNKATLYGRFWDSGSRTDWVVLQENGAVQNIRPRMDYPFSAADQEVDLTTGRIAISAGTCLGKPATAVVHIAEKVEEEIKEVEQTDNGLNYRAERKAEIKAKIRALQNEYSALL